VAEPMTNTELAEIRAYANGADHPMDSDDPGRNVARWLLAELDSRDATIATLSARCTAKGSELDECLNAMRAAGVELEARADELDGAAAYFEGGAQ